MGVGRKILLNILYDAQEKHGYLSEEVLKRISIEQNIPVSRLYGIARFYTMLKTEPQGKYIIDICGSPSCILNNGSEIEEFLIIKLLDTTNFVIIQRGVKDVKTSIIPGPWKDYRHLTIIHLL